MYFSKVNCSIDLATLAQELGGELSPHALDHPPLRGIATLLKAGAHELSFFSSDRFRPDLRKTKAGALIVKAWEAEFQGVQIKVKDPYVGYAIAAKLFSEPRQESKQISPLAQVDSEAKVGKNVTIYPFVVVEKDAVIGDEVTLYPGVFVGRRARIGKGSLLMPQVVVMPESQIGEHAIIHAGCVIGNEGFGFAPTKEEAIKIPQLGRAVLEDNVELGAQVSIARGALDDTFIRTGVKLDAKVHIGHNSDIGKNSMLAALAAVSGSTTLGRNALVGGLSGFAGHIEVGDYAQIGAMSGVISNLPGAKTYIGFPALPAMEWRRNQALIKRLKAMDQEIKALRAEVARLSEEPA